MKAPYNSTLHQLRCFVAVASELHFGKAATRLFLSPSAVSDQIAALERSLGVDLFIRSSRQVRLSETGQQLLPLTHKALASVDAIGQWAERYQGRASLRVGMVVSSPVFQQAMAEATRLMPDVSWDIKQLTFYEGYDALRRGELDCAFIPELGEEPMADLTAIPLWQQPCVLVVAEKHHLAHRDCVHLDELAGENFIAVRDDAITNRWFPPITAPHNADSPVVTQARTFEEVLELCRACIGVNIAGEDAAVIYPRSGIRFIPLVDAPQAMTYLYVRQGSRGATLDRFADVVTDTARSHARAR